MTIGLFGGTGFIGSHITEKLHKDGHTLRLLVRTEAETPAGTGERIEIVRGRLQDIDALKRLIHECDILIYTVGIIREYPQKGITFEDLHHDRVALTAKLAYEAGVKRYILISANGVKQDGVAYQTSKYRGKRHSRKAGWTGRSLDRPLFSAIRAAERNSAPTSVIRCLKCRCLHRFFTAASFRIIPEE